MVSPPTGVCEPSVPAEGSGVYTAEGGRLLHTFYCYDTQRLFHIKVNHVLLSPQVGCKAIVCPTEFRTQKYCDMLRQICPEIETSTPGDIRSARYSCWGSPVPTCTLTKNSLQVMDYL